MTKRELQTEFSSPQVSPGLLLWQVTNKWQGRQRKALVALDLTHVQFVLLASLVWSTHKNDMTQQELAGLTQIDSMMTSQVVRKLEQKRLLTRTTNTRDGRSFILSPTTAGIVLANKAIKIVEAVDRDFFAVLGKYNVDFISSMQALARQD